MALLFGVGLLMGLGTSPMLTYYAEADPQALWEAGAATALFIAGCGAWDGASRMVTIFEDGRNCTAPILNEGVNCIEAISKAKVNCTDVCMEPGAPPAEVLITGVCV